MKGNEPTMNLANVSHTAIYTLLCRAVETANEENPIIHDPMASFCLERLLSIVSEEEKKRIEKLGKKVAGIGANDTRRIAQRANEIDKMVNDYISNNPSCTVINLACGFDTRFWRIENEKCKYIEIDLPEVIALKKEILKDHLRYELIGRSVLDTTWIDMVTANGNNDFLLVAEGLIMYLPESDALKLFQDISQGFNHSQFILEMIPERYTKGFRHKILTRTLRLLMGVDISFVFGVQDPHQIESYGNGFKVIDVKGQMPFIMNVAIN